MEFFIAMGVVALVLVGVFVAFRLPRPPRHGGYIYPPSSNHRTRPRNRR